MGQPFLYPATINFTINNTTKYIKSFSDGLDYAYDNYYNNGYIPTNYINGWIPYSFEDERMAILSVSANIVMYAKLASYVA